MKTLYAAVLGLMLGSALALGTLTVSSCKTLGPLPPNLPTDVASAVSCVATALISGGSALAGCEVQFTPALIADALQILIHSTFGAQHPEAIPVMQARLLQYRIAGTSQ